MARSKFGKKGEAPFGFGKFYVPTEEEHEGPHVKSVFHDRNDGQLMFPGQHVISPVRTFYFRPVMPFDVFIERRKRELGLPYSKDLANNGSY